MTALEGITITNGYSQDIKSVQRYDRENLNIQERPCIHVLKGAEDKELVGAGWDVTLTVDLECYLFEDPAEILSTDEIQAAFQWDVEQALTAMDWGMLQADLQSVSCFGFVIEDEQALYDGIVMTLSIIYRLAEEDMTTPI